MVKSVLMNFKNKFLTTSTALILLFILFSLTTKAQFREVYNGGGGGGKSINGMSFITPSTGFVAFNNYIGFTQDSGRSFVQRTVTAGNTNFNGYAVNLTFGFNAQGVHAFSEDNLLAYGDFGAEPSILFSSNRGISWKLVFHQAFNLNPSISNSIFDIKFPDNGYGTNTGVAISENSIIRSVDNGQSWYVVYEYRAGKFSKLSMPNNNGCVIGGNVLFKTGNTGADWNFVPLPSNPGGGLNFKNVSFLNAMYGYITKDDDFSVYRTTDGGTNWTKMNDPGVNPVLASDMVFLNSTTGYITSKFGYEVYKTNNSGVSWELCKKNTAYQVENYGLNRLFFYDSQTAWASAAGSQFLMMTTNGGNPTIPKAVFTIDTANLKITGKVELINYSNPNHSFKWYRNDILFSTSYNASYLHNIFNPEDSIKLIVTSTNGVSDTLVKKQQFNLPPNTPIINSFIPTSGGVGSAINVTGVNFTGATAVSFGDVEASSFTINSATSITAIVASGASGNVSVTTPVTTVSKAGFIFTLLPGIASFTPTIGGSDTTIVITGNNFNNVSAVSFGRIAAKSFVVRNATSIAAVIGAGASGNVSVTNQYGTGLLSGFTFVPAPVLTSFSPIQGISGTPVTIIGTNLLNTVAVSFGGIPASSFTINSSTSITAISNFGATGMITVTTLGGAASLPGFTFFSPPTVESITPISGPVNTVVTITGTNFSPIKNNNIVYIGSIKVAVNSASSNMLTITVPAGLNQQPISVVSNGLTATSDKLFTTTFLGDSLFRSSSFSDKNYFIGGTRPENIKTADIDGDGKLDIISADFYYGSNNASVFILRNTTEGNMLSFASKVGFEITQSIFQTEIADLNGDGKPDLVLNYYDGIALLINTSTIGNISFTTLVTLPALSNGSGLVLCDVDRDGKVDILSYEGYNRKLFVYRNTYSSTGISFAQRQIIASDITAANLAVSDFNSDGKPDIAFTGSLLTILQNNSSPGNINFLPEIILGSSNVRDKIYLSDFNVDGKMDIARSNFLFSNFSVFKNTSVGGKISFADDLRIGNSTDVYDLSIADYNGDGKPDVVSIARPLYLYKNISATDSIAFAPDVINTNSATDSFSIITSGDVNLDGKSDLILGNFGSNSIAILLNNVVPPFIKQVCNNNGRDSIVSNLNGSYYQWQVNKGDGNFINIYEDSNYSGAYSNKLILVNIPSSWYGYQYLCLVDGKISNLFSLKFSNIWTGAISSAWENPGNWSCGELPDSNTDVIINSNTINLNSIVSVKSLTIKPGVIFTIGGQGKITITH